MKITIYRLERYTNIIRCYTIYIYNLQRHMKCITFPKEMETKDSDFL